MAIFGKLIDIQKQFKGFNELIPAFNYLEAAMVSGTGISERIQSMDCDQYEKVKITDDTFAIEQSYNTRNSEESLFESHIKYVDMQLLVLGEEIIEVAHIDTLEMDSEYNKEDDYGLYKASFSSKILMQEGDLSLLFPKDGHMPGIQSNSGRQRVFKTVCKVPVSFFLV